ncbi:hypothetical protein QJS10_CPA10g00556 [Acorus calamus]|uniref:Erythromycin biosynthesis protein CIII-like C-terminal domain-containing protein n=1 Tax=Acorus calamus TaxID=4465 RepID=A0AAV9E0Q5_ACOCL|nr:hypothetical protein QJS10_CPA10g00556 [Acorus calamus]
MAFGTRGDVFPIAGLATAFSRDQRQYDVVLITHYAHECLKLHLEAECVSFLGVSTPPVLSVAQDDTTSSFKGPLFNLHKKAIQEKHRQECLSAVERVLEDSMSTGKDFILINFFALEGWSLAELFQVRCVIAAPYVVPYSAPSSFERKFSAEFPLLYKYFQEAPADKLCWKDVIHWMWPLFGEDWASWRSDYLNISRLPSTDPITGLPTWYQRSKSPLLLYGFSKAVVECPGYWPSNTHICGFWCLPMEWQFSCDECKMSTNNNRLCGDHYDLQLFLELDSDHRSPIFVGLSSVGSMGFLRNPMAFLMVLKAVLEGTGCKFLLLTCGYEPLESAIQHIACTSPSYSQSQSNCKDCKILFNGHLFCFYGSLPYSWLFQRCSVVIHHGGSGSTAAALRAGVPQIICPFMFDQFYWAERMFWLGLAPEPLQKHHLVPEDNDATSIEQASQALMKSIRSALSSDMKSCAYETAKTIIQEDGVGEALKILEEDVIGSAMPEIET